MKTGKRRRKQLGGQVLDKAQAIVVKLSAEQMERLERHRRYLEECRDRPVSPTEAFMDVVGLQTDRRRRRT